MTPGLRAGYRNVIAILRERLDLTAEAIRTLENLVAEDDRQTHTLTRQEQMLAALANSELAALEEEAK